MKCRQCKGKLNRDGEWYSIRVYNAERMYALPFCTGVCLAKFAAEEFDKSGYVAATWKKKKV